MKEAKKRAYEAVKKLFRDYIEAKNNEWSWADENLTAYSGACEVYEMAFEEEWTLNREDRVEILGSASLDECEDFIRGIFSDERTNGIETGCFWDKAEREGFWKRGAYGTEMSRALENLTTLVTVSENGEFLYNVLRIK